MQFSDAKRWLRRKGSALRHVFFPNRRRLVRQFVRAILSARKEPHERAALLRDLITNGPAQHGIARFERVEHRALRGRAVNGQIQLGADLCELAKLRW